MQSIRIPLETMKSEFRRILLECGFTEDSADTCAEVFAVNSLEGVYSHGVYRFLRFVDYLQKGYVKPEAEPALAHSAGALEQWNGRLGPGILNARFCTGRAMELAEENGIGCVAIANTNHWMRGGSYGRQAAEKGFVFIGWTNTEQNMPAWGAKDSRLGNNPLVLAVPYGDEPIVLDFAMTQYSYGKMEAAEMDKSELPFPGGFDEDGRLTANPSDILKSRRALPIGYWKGAGLSLLLDILAAILSAGRSTKELSALEAEYGVSQVFIAIDTKKLGNQPAIQKTVEDIIADVKSSVSDETGSSIRYPGERAILVREENLQHGIPVNRETWEEIRSTSFPV